MTERKKLTLTKPEASSDARRDDRGPRRAPVRGPGTAPRARQTAEEAAKAREERATRGPRFDDRQGRDRPYSDRPHGDRPHSDRPRTNRPVGDRPDRPEGDRPFHDRPRGDRPPRPFGSSGPGADQRRDDRPRFRDDNRGGEGRRPQGGQHGGPQWGDARGGDRGPDRRGDFRGRPDDRNGPRYDSRQDSRGPGRNDRQDRPGFDRPRTNAPYQRERDDRDTQQAPRPPAQPPVSSHDDGKMRLSKLMSERGLASRREADEWIEQGWVRVEGQVVEELGTRVFPDVSITIDPLARTQQAERVTILINKPIGYVSGQAEDDYEPAVVLIKPENRWEGDRLPTQLTRGHLRHLAPAGRLDIDSTGLLVLTQDGRVAKALIGEDSGVEKEYLVRVQLMSQPEAEDVSKIVPPEDIELLRFGLSLDDRQLKPAKVSWQNEHQLRFVLREGRKRQIRRMCEQVGLKVVGLKRVRMGRIALGDLPLGQWRFLRPDERF